MNILSLDTVFLDVYPFGQLCCTEFMQAPKQGHALQVEEALGGDGPYMALAFVILQLLNVQQSRLQRAAHSSGSDQNLQKRHF